MGCIVSRRCPICGLKNIDNNHVVVGKRSSFITNCPFKFDKFLRENFIDMMRSPRYDRYFKLNRYYCIALSAKVIGNYPIYYEYHGKVKSLDCEAANRLQNFDTRQTLLRHEIARLIIDNR